MWKSFHRIVNIGELAIPPPVYVALRSPLRITTIHLDPCKIYSVIKIEWDHYGHHRIFLKELNRYEMLDDFVICSFNPN